MLRSGARPEVTWRRWQNQEGWGARASSA